MEDFEKEVSKSEFKNLYFKYSTPNSGWTEDYWNQFYEGEIEKRYFFTKPATPESTSMFIMSGGGEHRMIFLTEDAEESFFDFHGKD